MRYFLVGLAASCALTLGSSAASAQQSQQDVIDTFTREMGEHGIAQAQRCYKLGYVLLNGFDTYESLGYLADVFGQTEQIPRLLEVNAEYSDCLRSLVFDFDEVDQTIRQSEACPRFKREWSSFTSELIALVTDHLSISPDTQVSSFTKNGNLPAAYMQVHLIERNNFGC